MIDFKKYTQDENDLEFLEGLRVLLEDSQCFVTLKCKDFSFQIDPIGGGAQVWSKGKKLGFFKNIDELFLNFEIDGKTFIERISEIEYD